jgi:truncated hemoglobin YjbI
MGSRTCSVVLKTGCYEGRPVPAHLKLKTVVEDDFAIWLGLFRATARELCGRTWRPFSSTAPSASPRA